MYWLRSRIDNPGYNPTDTNFVLWLAIFCPPEHEDPKGLNARDDVSNRIMLDQLVENTALNAAHGWIFRSWRKTKRSVRAGVTLTFSPVPVFRRKTPARLVISLDLLDGYDMPSKTVLLERRYDEVDVDFTPRLLQIEEPERSPSNEMRCTTSYAKIKDKFEDMDQLHGEEDSHWQYYLGHQKYSDGIILFEKPSPSDRPGILVRIPFPDKPIPTVKKGIRQRYEDDGEAEAEYDSDGFY